MKKVSVIMPCYNDGKYIIESIESVLAQTYENIEIIIIDDGSTDVYTQKVLYNLEYNNVKLIRTENSGPANARNKGIKESSGYYILPVDADDIIDATYIEKSVEKIEENESIGVVYCKAELFGEKRGPWDLPEYSLDKMLLDNVVFVTALFRKNDWEKVGGFNPNMKIGMEDYDFFLSILEIEKEIVQLPEVLFYYRIKKKSRTTSFQENMEDVVDTYKQIYYNHIKLYNKHQHLYAEVLRSELIHQIFMNRKLMKSVGVYKKVTNIPILKRLIKKLL